MTEEDRKWLAEHGFKKSAQKVNDSYIYKRRFELHPADCWGTKCIYVSVVEYQDLQGRQSWIGGVDKGTVSCGWGESSEKAQWTAERAIDDYISHLETKVTRLVEERINVARELEKLRGW